MVKAYYVCEICHRTHDTLESAEECENRIPPQTPPIGMMFGDHRPGTMYADITLAIASVRIDGHYIRCVVYACRNNLHGDSLGGKNGGLCDAEPSKGKQNNHLDPQHPTFKRMVSFLQSKGIPITVWDGEEVTSLEQFVGSD